MTEASYYQLDHCHGNVYVNVTLSMNLYVYKRKIKISTQTFQFYAAEFIDNFFSFFRFAVRAI